jgi:hypothetical protein
VPAKSHITFLMQTLMIFIPFSASAWVLYVASPTIFKVLSLPLFVRDRACFCLRIQNNKILRGPCFRNRRCHHKSRYAGSNRNRFHMIFLGTLFKLHGTRSTCAMSLWLTELASPSSQAMVTSLQDVPTTVPRSVVVVPQQTRSPTLSVPDWSPVI